MNLETISILVLVGGAAIGVIGYGRLFRRMAAENPRLYRDLGRPSLGNTSIRTSRLIQRYIWSQRSKSGPMGRLARLLIVYLVTFIVSLIVLAVLLGTARI